VVSLKYGVIVVLIVIVAGLSVVRFWPSDVRAIRKQLALIETAGAKDSTEKPVEALFKAKQIVELFNDPCHLTVESAGHAGDYLHKQLMERIAMLRAFYSRVNVSLHDLAIEIFPEKTAVVRGTLRLRGDGAGEVIADVHEFRAEMRRVDGKWLFTMVEIVQVLER
jgi:hypothetical protein